MITLNGINMNEASRYLGARRNADISESIQSLFCECEKELLSVLEIKHVWKPVDLPFEEIMGGHDIEKHLSGCDKAVLLCATLGGGVDRLIRRYSVTQMDRAVVLDAMASAAIEQACDILDIQISEAFPEYFTTWRFSCGYGDYPIEKQGIFLRILDAPRKIGVCTAHSYALEPAKSVTAVIGLSKTMPEKKRRGCAVCSLRETCRYRKDGLHCGL